MVLEHSEDLSAFRMSAGFLVGCHLLCNASSQGSGFERREQCAFQGCVEAIQSCRVTEVLEGNGVVTHVGAPLRDKVRIWTRYCQCQRDIRFPHRGRSDIWQKAEQQLHNAVRETT